MEKMNKREMRMYLVESYKTGMTRLEKYEKYIDNLYRKIWDYDFNNFAEVETELKKLSRLYNEIKFNDLIDRKYYTEINDYHESRNDERIGKLIDKVFNAQKDIWIVVDSNCKIKRKPKHIEFNDDDYNI
jgi:hypothetical protein